MTNLTFKWHSFINVYKYKKIKSNHLTNFTVCMNSHCWLISHIHLQWILLYLCAIQHIPKHKKKNQIKPPHQLHCLFWWSLLTHKSHSSTVNFVFYLVLNLVYSEKKRILNRWIAEKCIKQLIDLWPYWIFHLDLN